ncbi:MAG: outer membrane beta-barrel protein [Planctomycetota bacterium]
MIQHRTRSLALSTVALAFVACQAYPDQTTRPTVRIGGVVASDYESELSVEGIGLDVDTDVTSFDFSGGITAYVPTDDILDRKLYRAELTVATTEFELEDFGQSVDIDSLDIAGGGRYYFGGTATIQPFVSGHGVVSILDDVDGVDAGTQFALRAGLGVEFALMERFFLDLGIDYTLPIIEAESDSDPFLGEVETEISGWALRIGAGYIF